MGMPEIFGCMVFNDRVMKSRLPHETYKQFRRALQQGQPLTRDIANVMADFNKELAGRYGNTRH